MLAWNTSSEAIWNKNPSIAQLVERRTVEEKGDILRSLVRIRLEGDFFLFYVFTVQLFLAPLLKSISFLFTVLHQTLPRTFRWTNSNNSSAEKSAINRFLSGNNCNNSPVVMNSWGSNNRLQQTFQPVLMTGLESPLLAPRRRFENVESAAKFLTETLPTTPTGSCKLLSNCFWDFFLGSKFRSLFWHFLA